MVHKNAYDAIQAYELSNPTNALHVAQTCRDNGYLHPQNSISVHAIRGRRRIENMSAAYN
jgi:hypothetical protein